MTRPNHFVIKREMGWGTWNLPNKAIPLANFSAAGNRARIEERLTGATRSLSRRYPGAKMPSGSLETPYWSEDMGWFWAAALLHFITTLTPVGGTLTREHGILPDDPANVASLSAQTQWSGATGVNYLGLVLNSLTISCRAGEAARLSADWIARDEAKVGGVWDYDGLTASPAIIATPTYFAATIPYLIFTGASIVSGGTPTLDPTKKYYTIAGGTVESGIEGFTMTIENNVDARVLFGAPTPQQAVAQDRDITFSFDYAPGEDIGYKWYDEYRAGSQIALQFGLKGPLIETTFYRETVITLPLVDFDPTNMPDLTGSKTRKTRAVTGKALEHSSGYDIGVMLRDTVNSYAAV